ncbi:hemolysin family protein [Gorillibacterium sp. sgz5001074]|uniref:hemolysin family protein n=1 Tax=Gorillibacterium sp. sgz5001074 TaxID=3446695 RepID=UPI003F6680D5
MDTEPIPYAMLLLLVPVLVMLNGFFVAAEFAIVKVRISRLDAMIQEGHLRARFARSVVGNLNAYLSACQLGITLTSLALGWVGEPAVSAVLAPLLHRLGASDGAVHTVSLLLGFFLITVLHITVGEQFPKTYAIRKAEPITLWFAGPLMAFFKLMGPLIWMLDGLSNALLRRAGIRPEEERDPVHSEEELRSLMKESRNSGLLDQTEFTMVDNIFDFSETSAREIMIPRTEMVCLYAGLTYQENMAIAIGEMLTRYPVCDPDKDSIIGFVHIKDLLKTDTDRQDIRTLIRPLLSVPESMPISALLRLMQKNRAHLVLLIDEYGGTSGLVTVEDILEEIVGEIQDEFDEERPAIELREGETYSVDGLMLIEEVNEELGLDIRSQDYDTIGGWLYAQVEIPPRRHQSVRLNGYEFVVEDVDHLRISRIMIRPLSAGEYGDEGDMVS